MNPDLISMLSSGATPEEQKAYMKNFSILCQGVGNTADGSVTYKIYKQMTGDITVGLTQLGGVRQIESEAKVDDVTVGGVSVVENKVAKIPAIPKSNVIINRIPLSGIRGNLTFHTNTTRELMLFISADTPLTVDKYIGSSLLIVPNGEAESRIQANLVPSNIIIGTDSSNSETLVTLLSTQFRAMAIGITETDPNGTEIQELNTASISIIIVTDGVVVALDKEKSQLLGQS